jgi:HSP20 family protein
MLTRFDPFAEMTRFQTEIARQLEGSRSFSPAVDIYEDAEAIHVKAELPGVKSEDLKIDVENNVLSLRGERKLERQDEKDSYHRVERWYGSFARQFMLPRTVDAEKIEASLKEGVLTVRLPKRAEVKPRQISIKAS